MSERKVDINLLRSGVFIKLNLKWYEHPFLLNSFKITKKEQIDALRELGIREIIYIPEKSDVQPRSPLESPEVPLPPSSANRPVSEELWEMKKHRMDIQKKRRERIEHCENEFRKSLDTVKTVMRSIASANITEEVYRQAGELVDSIVESLMPDRESALQIMNVKTDHENIFFHSLNVSVLSLMLGKELSLAADDLKFLGIGALFHDIGKHKIPKKILNKTEMLTQAEMKFIELHPRYGLDLLKGIETFPKKSLEPVFQHHERIDGTGYPLRIKDNTISMFARIVAITDTYDNHCNKINFEDSLTPFEALSYMYKFQGSSLDKAMLGTFIRCLGVFPPGTVVGLSNGMTGLVISVNAQNPTRPCLLLYAPDIPRKEAIVFDLRDDPGISIEKSISLLDLPQELLEYLSPRTRVGYFISPDIQDISTQGRKSL